MTTPQHETMNSGPVLGKMDEDGNTFTPSDCFVLKHVKSHGSTNWRVLDFLEASISSAVQSH